MTHQEKIAFIRAKCIARNPSIIEFPRFPEDSETVEAIKVLAKIANRNHVTKEIKYLGAINLKQYEEEKRTAYVRELEQRYPSRRPIRLADVLMVLPETRKQTNPFGHEYTESIYYSIATDGAFLWETSDEGSNGMSKCKWNLYESLEEQDEQTIDFIHELLK